MSSSLDMVLNVPALMEAELCVPIDVAADAACERLRLPLIGGPSGRGWSFYSTAQTCPHLWDVTHNREAGVEQTKPPIELQVGSLHHLLTALYYSFGLNGDGRAFYHKRGLLAPSLVERLGKRGRKSREENVVIPTDAADQVLAVLKKIADRGLVSDLEASVEPSVVPEPRPSMNVIQTAESLFDAHAGYYGDGREFVTPLAVEWFAEHPILGYTCRYDMIARLEADDPFVRDGQLNEGAIVVFERKTAKWLSEVATEGWFLDGEILGELLLWEASGCARLFGPLAGLIVDIVTKEKRPKFMRILVPPNPTTMAAHERGIVWQNAEMALWRASGFHPRRWVSCFRYGRKCGLYDSCRADTASSDDE